MSRDEPTILIIDALPLRNVGLARLLDRLSRQQQTRVASLTPEEAERWIGAGANCRMIIYTVGGTSVAEQKHVKRIRSLLAGSTGAPLVVFSDNDSREEIVAALNVGAQGFLFAGTEPHLAQQALSFVFNGGSHFPAAESARHRRAADRSDRRRSAPVGEPIGRNGKELLPQSVAADSGAKLTGRQKAVLERLGQGDSNKAIARQLGIREGTVKVHVRQIMRKLGVANRTQVAIHCAASSGHEAASGDRGDKGK
jgi:DNA-binding NarL/FixJ family response regulator